MSALVLRCCGPQGESYGSFRWPLAVGAEVVAPDWSARAACGNGLHGLLWGAGAAGLLNWDADARWMVVGIDEWVDIDGNKVKAPSADVVLVGDRRAATDLIIALGGDPALVVGSTLTGGYGSTLTGGDRSTLTGGDDSTLTGGDRSTLTGGNGSTLTGGYGSTLTGGDGSTLTGGYRSTLTGQWWDAQQERWRRRLAEVGEDGILPDVPYRLKNGLWVRVETSSQATA